MFFFCSGTNEIKGISHDLLRQYVEMRQKIDIETSIVFNITSLLALLETSGNDRIEVDPVALGKICQLLNTKILNTWEIMDDFIYLVQARTELERLEK